MTPQQARVLEIMQMSDVEVTNHLFDVAASIIGIRLDEPFRLAAQESFDPSSLKF